ncbi:polymerase [Clostridium beijerinckii]|nr:polymerase [Clostridium beijerinckii]
MKEIIKNIYDFVDNKFYFKLLYLFVSLTFVTILKYVPGIMILKYIALAWGIILVLIMIIEDYKRRKIYKFDIPLGIFMIITLLLNIISYRSIDNIKTWMINLILFVIIFTVDVFRCKKTIIKEMNIITYFYVIFMFIASSISLIMKFFDMKIKLGDFIFEFNGVNGGVFENKNAIAIAAALAIVMCIYIYDISKNHKIRIFLILNIILQTIIMMGEHGRSALLIVIAVVYTFIFVYNKNKYIRIVFILIPILICGTFLTYKDNIRDFTSGRSSLWTSAAIVIKENPLNGVGNNKLVDAVKGARETDDLPGLEIGGLHNIYVQIATVNGIISLLLFLTFIGIILMFIIQRLDKLKRKEKFQMTTLTSLVVGILAVNLFESTLIYIVSFISMIFWIYLGCLVSILDNKNIQ